MVRLTVRFCYGLTVMALVILPPGLSAIARDNLDEQLRQPVNREVINQQRDVADQLLRLGEQQSSQGDYTSALRAWSRAADLYYDIGDVASMERAYRNIGWAYVQLGDYGSAEVAVRRQLAIARDNQNFSNQIFAWNTLGSLRLNQGDVDSATQAYEEALNIAYSIQNPEGIGLSLSNLGLLSAAQGDYAAAINYYELAGNYRIRAGNLAGRANTNNNLGDAYGVQGQETQAIAAYRLALSYGRDSKVPTPQLHALDGLIDIYSRRRDWTQVRYYLDERIALTLNSDNEWSRLVTFKRLGEFYEATGEPDLAQQQYELALELAHLLEQKSLESELLDRLLSLQSHQSND